MMTIIIHLGLLYLGLLIVLLLLFWDVLIVSRKGSPSKGREKLLEVLFVLLLTGFFALLFSPS